METSKVYEAIYNDNQSDSQIWVRVQATSLDKAKKYALDVLQDIVKDTSEFTLTDISLNKYWRCNEK